ncbi:monodehydroascorbate reductase 5, chlorplastic-like isoform X1 [Cucumis melo]|uniref:Monodehydroascorbate reductase 5, chlorplastic-like isoform X1 n=1 Tax=Cucumis melo TaxID=3656 RepID=A0ABM3L9H4_CUCME|nr:monodehydroascorbate reductase 5, chlorplastic-like isoform X1 [Cucumis melo]
MIMVFNSIILPISYLFGTDSIAFQAFAPYERSTLTKGYLFPLDKKPTRLSGFHTCVGSGWERQHQNGTRIKVLRFPDKIGGGLPGVHYIRDVADADSLISSLEKAKKVVLVGGGYISMEIVATLRMVKSGVYVNVLCYVCVVYVNVLCC